MGFKSNKKNFMSAINQNERKTLKVIGEYTRGLGIANSPVGQYTDGRVGGNLRDSNDYQVRASNHRVIIGNQAEYAVYVHEGTRYQTAQPFLRVPVMQNADKIKGLAEKAMRID